MVAGGIKERGSAMRLHLGFPRAPQGFEGAFQPQTLGRLLLPRRRSIRRSSAHRPTQRRQFRTRLDRINVFQPVRRHRHRPGVHKVHSPALDPPCHTRPRPPFDPRHQLGTQRVAFDIAANGEKVFVFLNGEALGEKRDIRDSI
jgi:hypothetical protein